MAMVRSNMGPVRNLRGFDLRNGDVKDAVSLLTKAAIPRAYKWVPIQDLPHDEAMECADMFVKSALVELNGLTDTGITAEIRRKIAIILGVSRAVLTMLYRLTAADLIPGEVLPYKIRYIAPAVAGGNPTWALAENTSAEDMAVLNSDMAFTATEIAVMSDIVMCAVGLPAIQGASIMACGHHYLSDAGEKSRPIFEVIEKQFWKKSDTKTFMTENLVLMQDAMWHKAGHPINMQLKLRFAVDPTVADKIRAAGSGSSASRLPAREANLKAAETALTLLVNVRPFYVHYGGSMDSSLLASAIALTSAYQPAAMGADGAGLPMPGMDPKEYMVEDTPLYVKDRTTALEWVDSLMRNNMDTIAMAFGFFEALCETSQMSGVSAEDLSLMKANSLTKLKSNACAAYQLGREAYGDYKAFKNQQRAAGLYKPTKAKIR